MDITTRIDYSTDKASYLALAMLTAGATVIDSKGVYKVLGDET
jgi:hypothetical protein